MLKKSFIILTLILGITSAPLFAQEAGIGLKAGANVSTQLYSFQFTSGELGLNLDPSFTMGYHVGLMYRKRISRNFRLQTEPTFLNIGASYNDSFVAEESEFVVQTDSQTELYYIHLPFVLELTTTPPNLEEPPVLWEETTYHATIGLYGSYLVDANFFGSNSGGPFDSEEEFFNDVTSQFNNFDAGFIVGGGLEYGYQDKIGIETRLMLGMFNSGNKNTIELKPNNLSISVAVYYMF